jgi:RHH-type proline utilization regulon transcriptional repressor/proline dehydrogenase/delta 1-pyrroline-5-carboxylate dehydrogenase
VPDAETAIALTADQLGRADFDGAADSTLARLSSTAIAMSKKFLPEAGNEPGLMVKLGAKTVVAATLRAVQLLGRQFVLGQTIEEGMKEAASARKRQANLSFSFDMLGEGARTDADALRYLASYQNAITAIARTADPARLPSQNDGISIKLSALHPRYEDAQHDRVMRELVPRVWQLCEGAAAANLNLTIDAEEVDRLELSLDVFVWRCRLTRRARSNSSNTSRRWGGSTGSSSCAAWSRAPTGTPRSSARKSRAYRLTRCSRRSRTPT